MKRGERPFVVGRRGPRGSTLVLVRRHEAPAAAAPVQGPWTLTAVVGPAPEARSGG